MAANLGQTEYATTFMGRFLLKGFYSALLPVMETASYVIWHYLVSEDRDRLSYNQALGHSACVTSFASTCRQGVRHFVGWTKGARDLIGKSFYWPN